MDRRTATIAVTGLATGVAVAWIMVSNDVRAPSGLYVVLVLMIGWSFIAAGLVAWRQRPDNRIGPAMIAIGFLRFVAALFWSQDPLLFAVGHSLEVAYLVGVIYVVLAFPSGHLETSLHRWLFGLTVFAIAVLDAGRLALGAHDPSSCVGCPTRMLTEVMDAPAIARSLEIALYVVGGGVAVSAVTVLVRRWRHATPRLRSAIAPVLWTGAAAFLAVFLMVTNHYLDEPTGNAPHVLLDVVTASLAFAFLIGLGRTRLARSAVADLVIELGTTPGPGELRSALSRALRDPSLRIAYVVADPERYVGADGAPVELPEDGETAVTVVHRDGRTIAALLHDPSLREEKELVESVGAAAALALENERLQAELRVQLEELTASRTRIVEAAQDERRRIERDLHDGAQQRLVSVAMTLGLADSTLSADPERSRAALREARGDLSRALEDIRQLSHGIYPGILTERGLGPALDELAAATRLPVDLKVSLSERLPDSVETATYFFVSEALTNVTKHARATEVHVGVDRRDGRAVIRVTDDGTGGADPAGGSGLRGLRDRVEALGGRFSLSSAPGRGTVLTAEIPDG